ncbi:MAG TPA: glycosyltransferase family 1 protein [Rhodothermales bacterium]|nr:glycosyltransferase family 1 protein [Rhodothermales bacterium]
MRAPITRRACKPYVKTPPATHAEVPRRIALFTGAYNHIADGVSLTLNRLVSHMERTGADVLVFAPTVENPPVEHAGTLVPIPSISAPGRAEYRVALGLPHSARRRLAEFQPTLFHIATPDILGNQALRLAQKWGVPAVASYHTHFSSYLKYYGFEEFEGFLWKYLRRFYRHCEHVYVPSHSMAAVLRAHEITKGLRIWQRGVNTRLFNPERRSMTWRQTLDVAEREVLITFVGRLVWEKGLGVYADVIEALHEQGIPHRSMVVGDGPARSELSERLPETIFTGHLDGDALARAYASSDVFFFPSDTETFGNVTLEAMACGLPAVCADATGSSSLVRHGVSGFLAPAGDNDVFFEYVSRLATDAGLRFTMGENAVLLARQYEWDAVLSRIAGYYDEILNPNPEAVGNVPLPLLANDAERTRPFLLEQP